MDEILFQTAIKVMLKEIMSISANALKNSKSEIESFLSTNVDRYLTQVAPRVIKTKTLLHRHKPVSLEEVYVPLTISFHEAPQIDTDDIISVFERSRKAVIIGDAGSGKSTLVKSLFIKCIQRKHSIPVLIEFRRFNESATNFSDFLYDLFDSQGLAASQKSIEKLLQEGRFTFFLDGFDELHADKLGSLVNELTEFSFRYKLNRYLITARPYSNAEHLSHFYTYYINPLSPVQVQEFIKRQLTEQKELAEKIIESSKTLTDQRDYARSYLANPLLLSLYILTFQANSSIPTQKSAFYRRVIDTLFSEHDSRTKIGFEREMRSNLPRDTIEVTLKRFSFISFFEEKSAFDKDYTSGLIGKIKDSLNLDCQVEHLIYDLQVGLAVLTEDDGLYAFAHKSLQEYLATSYIRDLPSETKQKAYLALRDKLVSSSAEIQLVLTLCREIDSSEFLTYFLIPVLTDELKGYENLTVEEKHTKFWENHGILLHFAPADLKVRTIMYGFEGSVLPYILSQLQVGYTEFLETIFEPIRNSPQLRNYIKENPSLFPVQTNSNGKKFIKIDLRKQMPADLLTLLIKVLEPSPILKYIELLGPFIDSQKKVVEAKHSFDSDFLSSI